MVDQNIVTFDSRPKLRSPYVVCGLNGWVDGGDVSTGGVNYLIKQFKATKFAELQTSRYHVYQVPGAEALRPLFKMEEGIIKETNLPNDRFYYAVSRSSDHDLILFLGNEPSLNWEEYSDAVVSTAIEFGASGLYVFGGILDRSPYTRAPRVSCTCTSNGMKKELEKYNVVFSSREGPASFPLMLLHACNKKGLEGANLTVRVPYYPEFNVIIEYGWKSVKAVLLRLNHLMQLGLDFAELDHGIAELDGKLDFVRQQNPQFSAYIDDLEKNYVEMPYEEPLDLSGHDAVKFAEEFLRGNQDQGKGR